MQVASSPKKVEVWHSCDMRRTPTLVKVGAVTLTLTQRVDPSVKVIPQLRDRSQEACRARYETPTQNRSVAKQLFSPVARNILVHQRE